MALIGLAASVLSAGALPNADEIVRQSVANTQADWRAAPDYNFTERDVTVKHGSRSVKTYRVRMIDGAPYYELTAMTGGPLSPAQSAEENRKLQMAIEQRQSETSAQRQRRIANYERQRRQDDALMADMAKAFDYSLAGQATVNGRRCFVLRATPKPGYQPTSRDTKVLKGMRGTMWVDAAQYQWVKVEAEVFRPVTFGLFIAHVEPGTQFMLEQQPVRSGLWLPSHFSMRVKAKVMLWSRRSSDDESYSSYRAAAPAQAVVQRPH